MTIKQKYLDMMSKRAELINNAQEAFSANDFENGQELMDEATGMNGQLEAMQQAMDEELRFAQPAPAMDKESIERAEDRAHALRNGGTITFSAEEVRSALFNSVTLATGSLVEPERVGTTIHDNLGTISSILDQVSVVDLEGCNAISEPILWAEQAAQSNTVASKAGVARTATDPVFKSAKIAPYEVTVTSFVDRNLSRLTPIAYEAKIRELAMRALRREVAKLIYTGAGTDMYGIKTGVTTDGSNLFSTKNLSKTISATTLSDLVFSYGGAEELDGSARLYLTKADLQAFGAIRASDGRRLFEISVDAGNPNSGRITDGGLIVPYTLTSSLSTHSGASAGTLTMCYGNPRLYELGLFGPYSIRVDESVKAVERMNAILGDVFIGGNLVAKDAFVVASATT